MELDEILEEFGKSIDNYTGEGWKEAKPKALSATLVWIQKKLPKIDGEQTVYVQGMNAYRRQALKNLGIE